MATVPSGKPSWHTRIGQRECAGTVTSPGNKVGEVFNLLLWLAVPSPSRIVAYRQPRIIA